MEPLTLKEAQELQSSYGVTVAYANGIYLHCPIAVTVEVTDRMARKYPYNSLALAVKKFNSLAGLT